MKKQVDWWYGLYSGTDAAKGILRPYPHMSQCIYKLYPDPNNREVLSCIHQVYLPVVSKGNAVKQ